MLLKGLTQRDGALSLAIFYLCLIGFVEKEIKKANIEIVDTGEDPEVPFPRDMIDMEVTTCSLFKRNTEICCLLRPSAEPSVRLPTGHVREA